MMLSRLRVTRFNGPRLLALAAVLHLVLAIALFALGRWQVAPALVDRDGLMGSFAFDSYDYQRGAIEANELLRKDELIAWATAPQPLHVKIVSVSFALLSPLFGYSTLSAEPYNLVCYIAIVALVFALGREVGGERAGLLSAAVVALWPTFLLHTLQLLKDPLFITAALAFLLCAVTLLSRTYRSRSSAAVSLVAIVLVIMLGFVRFSFVLLMIGVAVLISCLLIVRQMRQRQWLFWNMAPAVAILVTGLILLPVFSGHKLRSVKRYSADQFGPAKASGDATMQVASVVRNVAHPAASHMRFPRRISAIRSRFAAAYSESGSLLDPATEFTSVTDLVRYVPRAVEIGMWAPFPSTWFSAGRRVGNAGKFISGCETLAIYLLQLLALVALIRGRRQLTLWFLLTVVVCGVTAIAFVVPNAGAIYRFRYLFWMLLIIAAMTGLSTALVKRVEAKNLKRSLIAFSTISLLCLVQGCASHPQPLNPNLAQLDLINFTGATFRAVCISPTTVSGWQENMLAGSQLKDGDTLSIQFDANQKDLAWDLKIEGIDGRFAEWKNLTLEQVSEITLVLKLSPAPVVVAEIE